MTKEKRIALLRAMTSPEGITELSDGWFEIKREDGFQPYLIQNNGKVDRSRDLTDVDNALRTRVLSHYKYLESLLATNDREGFNAG